jgi:hypothetical protein
VSDEDKSPFERYLETASPEEQRELGDALLAAQERTNPERGGVPESTIRISRALWLLVVVLVVVSSEWGEQLLRTLAMLVLLGAVAWFPNETAVAVGRLGYGPNVSRASNPRILFAIAWVFLALTAVAAVLRWVGGS